MSGLELRVDDRLRERANWGDVEGETWEEFLFRWERVDTEKSRARLAAFVDDIAGRYPARRSSWSPTAGSSATTSAATRTGRTAASPRSKCDHAGGSRERAAERVAQHVRAAGEGDVGRVGLRPRANPAARRYLARRGRPAPACCGRGCARRRRRRRRDRTGWCNTTAAPTSAAARPQGTRQRHERGPRSTSPSRAERRRRARASWSCPSHSSSSAGIFTSLARQAEDLLAQDVALHFARPAADRQRAGVEVAVVPAVRVGFAVRAAVVEQPERPGQLLRRLHDVLAVLVGERLADRRLRARARARGAAPTTSADG